MENGKKKIFENVKTLSKYKKEMLVSWSTPPTHDLDPPLPSFQGSKKKAEMVDPSLQLGIAPQNVLEMSHKTVWLYLGVLFCTMAKKVPLWFSGSSG